MRFLSNREMYWIDRGRTPFIEKANMDGSLRRRIVSSGLVSPNSLNIDSSAKKLYWTDSGTMNIEESDLDGGHRKVIYHAVNSHPFGALLYQGYIYWTDWNQMVLLRLNILSGENQIVAAGLSKPTYIVVHYPGMRSSPTGLYIGNMLLHCFF